MPKKVKRSLSDIDLGRLEYEWVRQDKLVRRYTPVLAEAELDLLEAEANLELVEARMLLRIRGDPKKFGFEGRPNKEDIKAKITVSKDYQEANNQVIQAEYTVKKLKGTMATLSNRRTVLENEVKLWLGDYFAAPRLPKGKAKYKKALQETRELMDQSRKRSIRTKGGY
jgi:hypothetical protein